MLRLLRLTSFSALLLCLAGMAEARTGAQLITDLRVMLGQVDSVAGRTNWTNVQLLQILNIAQDKVSARGRVIERDTVYGTAVSPEGGQTRLPVPSGFITLRSSAYLMRGGMEVRGIPLTSSDSLAIKQPKQTRQAVGDGNFLILEQSDRIVISPAFTVKDSIRVIFFANPVSITDSLECPYEDEWEVVLLYEAKMVALEKIRDEMWYALTAKERSDLLEQTYLQDRLRPQLVKIP